VHFIVTFSEVVSGVEVNDFSLTITGDISKRNGGKRLYTVTVNTGPGISRISDDEVLVIPKGLSPLTAP